MTYIHYNTPVSLHRRRKEITSKVWEADPKHSAVLRKCHTCTHTHICVHTWTTKIEYHKGKHTPVVRIHTTTTTLQKSELERGVSFWNNHCNLCWSLQRLHLQPPYTGHAEEKVWGKEKRERGGGGGGVVVYSWWCSREHSFPLMRHSVSWWLLHLGYFCRNSFLILQVDADFFLPGWVSGVGKRKGWGNGGWGFWFGSSKGFFNMLTLLLGWQNGLYKTP